MEPSNGEEPKKPIESSWLSRWTQDSPEIDQIVTALAAAQSRYTNAELDREADAVKYKYKYASLGSCLRATRESLAQNGIAWSTTIFELKGSIYMASRLLHTSGQWLASFMKVPGADGPIQQTGSGFSYIRRYLYQNQVGLGTEDDDGQAAQEMMQERRHSAPQEDRGARRPRPSAPKQEQKPPDPHNAKRTAMFALGAKLGYTPDDIAKLARQEYPQVKSRRDLEPLQMDTLILMMRTHPRPLVANSPAASADTSAPSSVAAPVQEGTGSASPPASGPKPGLGSREDLAAAASQTQELTREQEQDLANGYGPDSDQDERMK